MSPLLEQILGNVDRLAIEEQLEVVEHVTSQMRKYVAIKEPAKKKRKLSEFRGIAKAPLFGEDAQQWVSRTRQEGDEHRERLLRGEK